MPSSRRSSAATKKSVAQARRPVVAAKRPSRFRFITDTISEMKKVTWLTRRETAYLTGLVLLVSITAGVVLGLIDLGFSSLVDTLLLGG
ncbi:MAG TPA: preprotein translocase subunit SecE [Dehalococcoidia bacterium]|nr:preprotein translocase subunit SecE [Dehalococcoidia bacterium]